MCIYENISRINKVTCVGFLFKHLLHESRLCLSCCSQVSECADFVKDFRRWNLQVQNCQFFRFFRDNQLFVKLLNVIRIYNFTKSIIIR